jgi:hypothetical protein
LAAVTRQRTTKKHEIKVQTAAEISFNSIANNSLTLSIVGRFTGKREVISSSIGLVPKEARLVTWPNIRLLGQLESNIEVFGDLSGLDEIRLFRLMHLVRLLPAAA